MTEIETVQSDLHFIRRAVQSRQQGGLPLGIALYWGLATLIGFALADFAPQSTGLFWLVASPVGFVFSMWLGKREAMLSGAVDRAEGWRIMWHWLGMMGAILLAGLLVHTGKLDGAALGQVIVLIVALSYFFFGLHFERSMLWISGLMAAGYVALMFVHTYAWTALGVLLCIALVGAGLSGRRAEHAHG